MMSSSNLNIWLILMIIGHVSALSFNQPKFCSNASWNPNATTFANRNTTGLQPWDIFITTNNTIYVVNQENNSIVVWSGGSTVPTGYLRVSWANLYSVFVTTTGDIYISTDNSIGEVSKWPFDFPGGFPTMQTCQVCLDLFVDISDNLYCSMGYLNQVVTKSLNSFSDALTIVAGTGSPGSASNMLNTPYGIFVDTNFDLYVADCGNNRIQLFQSGQLNATTIAGNGSLITTITLNCPTGIVLDADKYLYIVDQGNSRVVGSGPNDFQCLVGCSGPGVESDQLYVPQSLSFDSYGNIFVVDKDNSRIQQFLLMTQLCNETTTTTTTEETTTLTISNAQNSSTSVPNTVIINSSKISYNQPRFNAFATWNPNAITFSTNSTIGMYPYGIFINTNNTIYVADQLNDQIQIWFNNSINPTQIISGNLSSPYAIFVTINGDIYVNNGINSAGVVNKWTLNTNTSIVAMYAGGECFGLFVDINDILYCSISDRHQVVTKSLNSVSDALTIVAGTGCPGSDWNMLDYPIGIFVDTNFDLYVADCGNNRIQLFQYGQLYAITPAGNGSFFRTITLNCPTGIVLNADNYLFIVDQGNNRIVRSGPNGFWCLVGCSGSGSGSSALQYPVSMAFDSYGNIFVTDPNNNRIQKFILPSTTLIPTPAMTTTSKSFLSNQNCYSPNVTLIPGESTLSSPIQFHRSQDFYIVSIIKLNCNNSLSTITQWTVKNCISNCSNQIQLDPTIITTLSELYIPARILAYGVYELKLTVTMTNYRWLTTSSTVYVQIIPSSIIANIVQLGTSMITSGHDQDLKLDPGTYSVDPDENVFNSSDWKYEYYCRIYGSYMFPSFQGSLLTIDDPRIDPSNPSCLGNRTNNKTALVYGDSINSSLTILSGSLQSNRTYQFMVQMENRRNSSLQVTGYVLVKVEDTRSQMILIGCIIWTMCVSNVEFQLVNPTTQVALFSICIGNCTIIQNITWNIYYGTMNSSLNVTEWTLFNQTISYQNIWFFGTNTSNFTSTNQLFLSNSQINLWQFEVVYISSTEISSSALNFIINQPPFNGSCLIDPLNGTTSSLFTISCSDWFDEHGIKDYSLYVWTNDPLKQTIIAFSSVSTFQVQLPAGDDQTSILNIVVYIRDQLDCITEYNISSITVSPDLAEINNLIENVQSSSNEITNNPIVQLLASGNQNIVSQIITSISQQFNKMNNENLAKAVSNGVPATSISISSLGSQRLQGSSISLNISALNEYNKELNSQANVRDYLITFITNLAITTSNSIKLQSSSLAEFTQSTNQLTRAALTIVSEKCYQLSLALYSMLTTIAYEDVQTSATQLIQCATNILTAVNGPLQQRTIVLDLDSSRASAFPDDYDTDLDFVWSNLKLFADGNDFSWETIQKGRNIYYQKQLANQIMNQVNEIISLLTSTINIHLNIEQSSIINTSEVFMSLETKLFESLSKKIIKQIGNAQIQLPSNFNTNISSNSIVSIRSMMEPLASYGNSKFPSNTNVSTSISFSILDLNENEISIETNENYSIEIIIPYDPNLIIPSMILQNVTTINSTPNHQLFNLHYVNITSILSISVHLEIHPLETNISYLLIYKFDQLPQLNSSINQIDGWTLLCSFNLTNESIYTYFIDNQKTFDHQSLVFGLRELNSTEMIDACSNISIINPPITNQPFNFTSDYELRISSSGCYYLDENNNWQSDGLIVGSLTNHDYTQCFSTHLTTFAGGFVVLPEPINWNYIFTNADFMKNKTVYLTVICISIIYLILIIYARFKDKKDVEKLGVTPLPDNHRSDEYFYQIIIFTGQRKDAGTKSKVHFILSGDKNETYVRTFADPHRQILQRGGIDAFIMAVRKPLGFLNYIRIWHDNTGQGSSSSWFLKYLIVRDLQTMEKFHFICQRWFAVEKDDGKIERILPVAGEIEKNEFSYLISKQAYRSISDGHLWLSIFSRPPSNKFTRVQRCTCCFVLLFISMLLNIMYYDLRIETQMNNSTNIMSLSLGPLFITREQIGIGIIAELLSFLPSLLLVQFFRRIRSRQQSFSPLHQTLYRIKPNIAIKIQNIKKEKSRLTFPWWCLFIAYGLCVILVSISIFFIIVRGIEFGELKTQQWLTSILSGFFSSILLTQPIKILCLAIFFAFICRKSNDDEEANEYLDENTLNLEKDEEYLHSTENKSLFTYRPPVRTHRLNEAEIVYARNQRLKEIQMRSFIRETFIYLCFLSLLFIVTYTNRNSNSFLEVQHLRKYLLNSRQIDLDYTKISTINEYWNWLDESFVGNIHAQQWYNGDPPRNLSGFINDKSNRLIGWGTMRQLRVKSNLCSILNLNLTCSYDYSFSNEEKASFEIGWKNETTTKANSTIQQAFQYQSSDQLDTYVYIGNHASYSGGGYVYEFRGSLNDIQSNLSELYQLGWIDSQTRAIIIQLNLYNPNVQLFISVTLLTEFLSTTAIDPQSQFEPMNFYAFTSIFQLIYTIIYMIFILYFMLIELQLFFQLKWNYFYEFWSLIQVGIIICSWIGVGIYIWRYHECSRIGKLFEETNGYVYINLQLATYINDFLTFLYGFCCFFGTIKLIRLCRFNQRIYIFIETLKKAAIELISFAFMFSIVFFSFICLFYFLFQSKLSSCSSLFQTSEMLFEMTLRQIDASQLNGASAFFASFCFCLFIFIVIFLSINMFLSIIIRNFRQTRKNINNDQEIYSFMFDRFLRWIGLKKRSKEEIHEERDALMRNEYFDPIERFPEKIDQLLNVLNQLYMTQRTERSIMQDTVY